MTSIMTLLLTVFIQTDPQGSTPVWLPLLIIIILLLLLWWGLTRNSIPEGHADTAHGDDHGHDDTHDGHVHTHDDHGQDAVDDEHSNDQDHGATKHVDLTPEPEPEPEPEPQPEPQAEPVVPLASSAPDDLKKIEGIGPKINSVLNAAGITMFSQVAATSVEDLNRIVKTEGGVRIAFPESWPEQATLAADGNWEALDKLQDALQGGRKV